MTGCYPGRRARLLCSILFLIAVAAPLAAQTWTKLTAPGTSPVPDLYGVHFFTRDSGYVCGEIAGVGKLYLTVNGGVSWTLITLPGAPGPLNDIYFRPASNVGIVVGNGGYAAITNDHGATWIQRSVLAAVWTGDIQGVYFKDATTGFVVGKALAAGAAPRFAKTVNAGLTWTTLVQTGATTTTSLYDIDFGDQSHGVVVGSSPNVGSGQIRKSVSTDGGGTWETNGLMGGTTTYPMIFPGVDAADGTATVYAAGGKFAAGVPAPYGQVMKSTDNGATWNVTNLNGLSNPAYSQPCNGVIAITDQIVFASAQGGKIYRTMDAGGTWSQEILPGAVGTAELKRFSETPTEDLYVVGKGGTVLRATLIGHGLYANTDLQFRKSCPGDQITLSTTITNVGTAKLKIDSIPVIQPAVAGVAYTVVSFPPSLAIGAVGTIIVRADVAPFAGPGLYSGSMRVRTSDSNYLGRDTLRVLPLVLPVTTKSFSLDTSAPRDAGSLRVGFSTYLPLSNFLTVTGECPIRVTSIRLAVGTDFSTGSFSPVTLSSAQKFGLTVSFEPKKGCARYDTLIVTHDGINPAPIRIPISGTGLEQAFAASPFDTLFFGDVLIGAPTGKPLRFLNQKPGGCLDTTSIFTFRIDGPNRLDFSTSFSVPAGKVVTIPPDSVLAIPISATASAPGLRIAYVISTNSLPFSPPDTVVLVINGVQPNLANTAQSINFGLLDVGGRRDSTVTDFLINLGSAPARVDTVLIVGVNAADFAYRTPASPFTLPIAGKQTISISFQPTTTGDRSALLEIRSSALTGPLRIPLNGKGVIAQGGYRNGVVICPETSVNACGDTTLANFLFNRGTVPLRIKSVRITDDPANGSPGDSAAFSIVMPKIPPDLVIAPGDSAAITVRFCAKEPRPYYALLALGTNSDSAKFHFQLIGPAKSSKVISVDSILFAATRVVTVRDTVVSRMIFNREAGPLMIDSMSISGADELSFSIISPSGAFSIPPGGDTSVAIRFKPARRSRHVAILEIYTSQGHRRVILSGPAIYPFLEVIPDPATSFNVRIGSTRTLKLAIVNSGDDSARVENAIVTGSSAFSNVSAGPFPARLLPGESIPVTVAFTPDHLCAHPATIELLGEGVRGIYAIADTIVGITGNGVTPMIGSRDKSISFGPRQIGSRNDSALNDFAGNIDFAGLACVDSTMIDSISISGSTDFTLLVPADPLTPRPMPPGALLPFTISFTPSASGLRTAQLNIYFDGSPDSVRRIDLLGAGSSLPIEYGPAKNMIQIDFGNLRPGSVHDSSFTATNISGAPLTIDEIASANPEMRVMSPIGFPLVMSPRVPITIQVRFAPVGALGPRSASILFRAGAVRDSAFRLLGNAVRDALRSRADTVDFGIRPPNSTYDSVVTLINEPFGDITDPALLDSAHIDHAAIVAGNSFYRIVSIPSVLNANARDSARIRFTPGSGFGARRGALRLFYNRRTAGTDEVFDSLTVNLEGSVGTALTLGANLGNDTSAAPGTTIIVPIEITGDLATAAFDSLEITIGFRKTLLEPVSITVTQSGVSGTIYPPDNTPTTRGTARIFLQSTGKFSAGMLAEITFKVLLGDSLRTVVSYDSIVVPGRPGISFLTDSIGFSIENFCDPSGRLIRFDSSLAFASKPNPALRATTFQYTLPAIVDVRLSVYDGSGAEMARLADGRQGPGTYVVPFDAHALSSGTYFCVLKAGRFTKTLILRRTE